MGTRPDHVKPPVYLSADKPVPRPAAPTTPASDDREPTRYGDWELKGVAVDF